MPATRCCRVPVRVSWPLADAALGTILAPQDYWEPSLVVEAAVAEETLYLYN